MENLRDISTLDDVKLLVDTFYDKVRKDKLLAPVFNERIQDRWPTHLEKMYTFWQTVLLGEHTYFGSPFVPHADLPVQREHFTAWLNLFYATLDELFQGPTANEAKWRADKMALMFEKKIAFYQKNNFENLL